MHVHLPKETNRSILYTRLRTQRAIPCTEICLGTFTSVNFSKAQGKIKGQNRSTYFLQWVLCACSENRIELSGLGQNLFDF